MWIDPSTLHTYTTHAEIRAAFRKISFPTSINEESIASVGLLPVVVTAPPAINPLTERAVEVGPALIEGRWTQAWAVEALTTEEQAQARAALISQFSAAAQARLDAWAKTRNYDGILSLCTYATSTVPQFASEGQRGVDLRDATWAALYAILAQVEAGTRTLPASFAAIEGELPALTWSDE